MDSDHVLTNGEISRYARQLIMPQIGTEGQKKLLQASILLIGAGGLCSSAAPYLAGAGIGKIGIVDFDTVELSNLHRQIIHTTDSTGENKAVSAKRMIDSINCIAHPVKLTRENAFSLFESYDVIVDCSDNPSTRYLINDACVLLDKPLVSGSAISLEGQASVFHYKGGPCYRCIYPKPSQRVVNCSNAGVLGMGTSRSCLKLMTVVPGLIGCIQAIQATKILLGSSGVLNDRLLIFDAESMQFRNIEIGRNKSCAVCGDSPQITQLDVDYHQFCDFQRPAQILDPAMRVSAAAYKTTRDEGKPHLLIDVRSSIQYQICSLPHSLNIPLRELESQIESVKQRLSGENLQDVFVMCRRGVDSVTGTLLLHKHGIGAKNVDGGVAEWARSVDPEFPSY